ncbi:hypothetical protein FLONG3_5757 [Fusarium longipes]|uniref:Uncharacterized protein n=1 Tax=Fusarium longipes TaxID=694270 RepID=A0A395ST46_9HYPO|nr:hypothetical protein FLONG3_5757 [Fusarium longipes]
MSKEAKSHYDFYALAVDDMRSVAYSIKECEAVTLGVRNSRNHGFKTIKEAKNAWSESAHLPWVVLSDEKAKKLSPLISYPKFLSIIEQRRSGQYNSTNASSSTTESQPAVASSSTRSSVTPSATASSSESSDVVQATPPTPMSSQDDRSRPTKRRRADSETPDTASEPSNTRSESTISPAPTQDGGYSDHVFRNRAEALDEVLRLLEVFGSVRIMPPSIPPPL